MLTPRQVEIVELIARGLENKEIANTLSISMNTVKTHILNILERMEALNRANIVYKYYVEGGQ